MVTYAIQNNYLGDKQKLSQSSVSQRLANGESLESIVTQLKSKDELKGIFSKRKRLQEVFHSINNRPSQSQETILQINSEFQNQRQLSNYTKSPSKINPVLNRKSKESVIYQPTVSRGNKLKSKNNPQLISSKSKLLSKDKLTTLSSSLSSFEDRISEKKKRIQEIIESYYKSKINEMYSSLVKPFESYEILYNVLSNFKNSNFKLSYETKKPVSKRLRLIEDLECKLEVFDNLPKINNLNLPNFRISSTENSYGVFSSSLFGLNKSNLFFDNSSLERILVDTKAKSLVIADELNLPKNTFVGQMNAESNLYDYAISTSGAVGVGQIMPKTAIYLGLNVDKTWLSILSGEISYLKSELKSKKKNWDSNTIYGSGQVVLQRSILKYAKLSNNDPDNWREWLPLIDERFNKNKNISTSALYMLELRDIISKNSRINKADLYKFTLVAYNGGPGYLRDCINKLGHRAIISYDDVRPYLRAETKNYVSKIIASSKMA